MLSSGINYILDVAAQKCEIGGVTVHTESKDVHIGGFVIQASFGPSNPGPPEAT